MWSKNPFNVQIIICFVQTGMNWSHPQKLTSSSDPKRLLPPLETDCRFWVDGATHAKLLRHHQSSAHVRVFYWWNSKKETCSPCTRCNQPGLVTFIPCGYFRDTRCVSQEEMDAFLQERRGYYYGQEQGQYDEGRDDERDDEAVVVYNADGPVENTPEVYGKEQFHSAGESDSPTSEILKKRLNESGQLDRQKLLHGATSPYGMPTFYSNADKGTNNAVSPNARPIVEVAKEFLSDRLSGETSTLRNERNSKDFKSLQKLLRRYTHSYPTDPEVAYEEATTNRYKPTTKKDIPTQMRPKVHPEVFERNSRAFLPTVEGETDMQNEDASSNYGIQHDETDTEVTTSSPGDTAFRELFHMLEDNEAKIKNKISKSVDKPNNFFLESLFGLISLVVLVLLCVLSYILFKTRARSKFQILDDQSNPETHHITSAFHTSNSAASTSTAQTRSHSAHLITNQACQSIQPSSDTVPPAVVRSLKNIRKEVIVDMGGRTVVR